MFNTPQYDEDENFYIPSPPPSAEQLPDEDHPESGWTRRRMMIAFVAVIVIVALLGMYLSPIIQASRIQDLFVPAPIVEPQMRT